MSNPKSEWQTEELTTGYLEGVRGAIPGAELQFSVIDRILQSWCHAPSRILDLGCGDGILGYRLLQTFPLAHGTFVDFSEPMLDAAKGKVSSLAKAKVVKADFSSPQWLDIMTSCQAFDIVISGFAIHHLPNERKKALYSEIYDHLVPGGVFLNLEHVASFTSAGEELFDEFFIDHLHNFHATTESNTTREAIANTYYHRSDKKENILLSVNEQCVWLREIGFNDVDCFFKVFELALFGGRKS